MISQWIFQPGELDGRPVKRGNIDLDDESDRRKAFREREKKTQQMV
jgi:hypothetical protein